MKNLLLGLAAASLLAGGCASVPESNTSGTASARQDLEFTTGSNIPRRSRMGGDAVNTMSAEDFDRARTSGIQGPPSGAPVQ